MLLSHVLKTLPYPNDDISVSVQPSDCVGSVSLDKTKNIRSNKKNILRHAPTYLYLQRNTYYFRYAFSAQEKIRFTCSEIRLSLRTGFVNIAKKIARQLRVFLEDCMMEDTKNIKEIRKELAEQLEKILENYTEKRPVHISDIKKRLNSVLCAMLDNADKNLYSSPDGTFFQNEQAISVTPKELLENNFHLMNKVLLKNQKDLFSVFYPDAIIELLHQKVFTPEELTHETIAQILNEYKKIQISFNRIMSSREDGNYSYEQNFVQTHQTNQIQDRFNINSDNRIPFLYSQKEQKSKKQILISGLIELYCKTKIDDKHWTERNLPTHKNRLVTILDILGDVEINCISREDMRDYRKILLKLPVNRKKSPQYKNKTIDELLKMDVKNTLSIETVNKTIESISSMFSWAVSENLLEKNNAKDLAIKETKNVLDLRETFTTEELKKIFNKETYTQERFPNPAYYWCPIIGLYTGMRLEEIAQLHIEDISSEENIWYFDVNQKLSKNGEQLKNLKSINATRKVPMHQDIISLGFLEYIKTIQEQGHERVFPKLNKTSNTPKYGKQVGKQFSALLKKHNIQGKKSFHSLRHTFSDFFKKNYLHTDLFRQVFGHAIHELAGKQYGSSFSVTQCYNELILKLDYDMLFSSKK